MDTRWTAYFCDRLRALFVEVRDSGVCRLEELGSSWSHFVSLLV